MNPFLGVGASALGFWHGYGLDAGRELMRAGSRGAAFAQLARLARQPGPVVADRGLRGGWYDQLLARDGFDEELCLVLWDGSGVWGLLGLKRAQEGGRSQLRIRAVSRASGRRWSARCAAM